MTVNAGVEKGGKTYYFLRKAYEQGETFQSTGFFHEWYADEVGLISKDIFSVPIAIPETGKYRLNMKIRWAGGYNAYHNYRRNSFYQFITKIQDKTLTDTGMHSLQEDVFYPYSWAHPGADNAKWFDLGNIEEVLSGGGNNIVLQIKMKSNNNKHSELYVDSFQISLTYLGE